MRRGFSHTTAKDSHMHFATSRSRLLALATIVVATVPLAAHQATDGPAAAVAPSMPAPVIEVTSGGQPVGALLAGDRVSVSATQGSPSGADGQFLETVWEPGTATIDVNTIDAPEGFTLEYRTGDATWSATRPSPTSLITGVRAVGGVTSSAFVSGVQTWDTFTTGELVSGAAAFQGSSGGDGWDVFFNADATKVFNIWHHNSSAINLDCHVAADGSSCYSGLNGAGGTVFQVNGYMTGNKSGGGSYQNKLYVFTAMNSGTYPTGFYCIDVTGSANPTSCGTPFIQTEANGGGGLNDYAHLTEVVRVGSKMYAFNTHTDRLLCVDANTGTTCTNQPYDLGAVSLSWNNTFLRASGGKVFVTTSDGKLSCFDPATNALCGGNFPVSMSGTDRPIAADGSGGVCFLDLASRSGGGDCVNSSGAQYALPSGLASALTSYPMTGLHRNYGSVATSGTRLYWGGGPEEGSPDINKYGVCFDFADPTTPVCTGFTPTKTLSRNLYATVVDPVNPNCIWGNGDNGKISSFNATTGRGGCTLPIPEVTFPQEAITPELACQAQQSQMVWREFRLDASASAIPLSDLTLEVYDSNGATISGWNAINLGSGDSRLAASNGVVTVNLATLAVASTGASPEFRVVTAAGTLEANAQLLTAGVVFDSAPPQLCFDLQVATLSCPTGLTGIAPSATPPGLPLSLVSTTLVTTSGVASSASATNDGTVGPVSGCVGTVVGIAIDASGNPVRDVPVALKTGSTTHATVYTNAAGHAVFTNVYPFATSASALQFLASGSFQPVDPITTVDLSSLSATGTVTGSAMTYAPTATPALPLVNIPVPTTSPATVPPVTTTAPPRSTTTTTVPAPPAGPRTPPPGVEPVRVADPAGEAALPELIPGESQVLDNGVPVDVDITVENTTDLVMGGQDWQLRLKGDCNVRLCTITEQNAREVLELEVDGAANVNGFGFKPGTLVHIWLFSDPIYLGSLLVAEDGTFTGSVDLLDVEFGEHTLQVNGISYDDKDRTANLGVVIRPNTTAEPTDRLPSTGTDTNSQVIWALLLTALGTALVVRRRRHA